MSVPLKFHKVYSTDGGPRGNNAPSKFHIGTSKPVKQMLGALQSIRDKKQLERKRRW